MTPEELNRTLDFIAASQARLFAAQEQEREDRVAFEKWSKNLTVQVAQVLDQQARLLIHQSRRLDGQDKILERQDRFQRQALHLLNMILDRLPPAPTREAT